MSSEGEQILLLLILYGPAVVQRIGLHMKHISKVDKRDIHHLTEYIHKLNNLIHKALK
jgi:hypothetical protein